MKLKYLDRRNYRMLVPIQLNAPEIIEEFDELLVDFNASKEHFGLMDKLIQHNQKSNGKRTWQRYYPIDIDFCIKINNIKQTSEFLFIHQTRPAGLQRIILHFRIKTTKGHEYDYKIPLQCLLKGWGRADNGYQVYVHTLTYGNIVDYENRLDKNGNKVKEISYVGITGRNWLKRFDEHIAKVRKGIGYLFHQAMRDSLLKNDMVYSFELYDLNLSFDDAMNIEEILVDIWSTLAPQGFNMISGGFRGYSDLAKRRLLKKTDIKLKHQDMLDKRDEAVAKFIDRELKEGNPNPLISDWWSDDENYWRAMEGHSKRLNMAQVNKIWVLYRKGLSLEQIREEVGALNERQVKGVLDEKHYKRQRKLH